MKTENQTESKPKKCQNSWSRKVSEHAWKNVPWKSFQVKELQQPTKRNLGESSPKKKVWSAKKFLLLREEQEMELKGKRAGKQVIPNYPTTSHLTHEQTAVLWKKCVERLKVSGHRPSCGWVWYKQEHWRLGLGLGWGWGGGGYLRLHSPTFLWHHHWI